MRRTSRIVEDEDADAENDVRAHSPDKRSCNAVEEKRRRRGGKENRDPSRTLFSDDDSPVKKRRRKKRCEVEDEDEVAEKNDSLFEKVVNFAKDSSNEGDCDAGGEALDRREGSVWKQLRAAVIQREDDDCDADCDDDMDDVFNDDDDDDDDDDDGEFHEIPIIETEEMRKAADRYRRAVEASVERFSNERKHMEEEMEKRRLDMEKAICARMIWYGCKSLPWWTFDAAGAERNKHAFIEYPVCLKFKVGREDGVSGLMNLLWFETLEKQQSNSSTIISDSLVRQRGSEILMETKKRRESSMKFLQSIGLLRDGQMVDVSRSRNKLCDLFPYLGDRNLIPPGPFKEEVSRIYDVTQTHRDEVAMMLQVAFPDEDINCTETEKIQREPLNYMSDSDRDHLIPPDSDDHASSEVPSESEMSAPTEETKAFEILSTKADAEKERDLTAVNCSSRESSVKTSEEDCVETVSDDGGRKEEVRALRRKLLTDKPRKERNEFIADEASISGDDEDEDERMEDGEGLDHFIDLDEVTDTGMEMQARALARAQREEDAEILYQKLFVRAKAEEGTDSENAFNERREKRQNLQRRVYSDEDSMEEESSSDDRSNSNSSLCEGSLIEGEYESDENHVIENHGKMSKNRGRKVQRKKNVTRFRLMKAESKNYRLAFPKLADDPPNHTSEGGKAQMSAAYHDGVNQLASLLKPGL